MNKLNFNKALPLNECKHNMNKSSCNIKSKFSREFNKTVYACSLEGEKLCGVGLLFVKSI